MSSINSLPEYAAVFKHCPNIIRGIISLKADGYSCRTLFKTLTASKCDCCSSFGYYLYLVSCKRVCYMCFKYGVKHFPVRGNYISKATGLRRKKLDQVPHILGLPGRWAPAGERRVKLYDIQTALELVGKDGSQPRPEQKLTVVRQRFLALVSAPHLDASGREADWGQGCSRCDRGTCLFRKYTRDEFADHVAEMQDTVGVERG
ncbi:hypothetical protein N0V84_003147 [Fusarium piperis]|uniref:Uncharacterized protein n=1 Tax=Fusarium piperis TaxID=1435070 RepID=A0A9W8WI66_9HYPO|nr:hypothetical protein N0V84_003147 [Fusarium piperis]